MVPSGLMADIGQFTEQGERQMELMNSHKGPDQPRTIHDPVLRVVPVVPRKLPNGVFMPTENGAITLGHLEIAKFGKQVAGSIVNTLGNSCCAPEILCRKTDLDVTILHQFWIRSAVIHKLAIEL